MAHVQPGTCLLNLSLSQNSSWARTTAEQGLFLCAEPHRCSHLYWGAWAEGLCPSSPQHRFAVCVLLSRLLGTVSIIPSAESQCRFDVGVLLSRPLGTLNSHEPQQHPWPAVPFLTQDLLWDFTAVTQWAIQSLEKQEGIFSMVLPIFQHLGSPDIIKLCLVVPSFLSTSRSSFKQLFSWLSHRQPWITCWARNFTSLG